MRRLALAVLACALTACATAPAAVTSPAQATAREDSAGPALEAADVAPVPVSASVPAPEPASLGVGGGVWIGAAAESSYVLAGTRDHLIGVWVEIPAGADRGRVPLSLTLTIDTSGSMAGEKIGHARDAARVLVEHLADGDFVAIHAFADDARELVAPTAITPASRARILGAIAELSAGGSTNLYGALVLGESRAQSAPATHPVRRLVVISDGRANVGPSSPAELGAVAELGARRGVQVTALGVGLDYDEHTLNALAIRSSGRLYHLSEPSEMASIAQRELDLLQATMAVGAYVEIVPAPGVVALDAGGVRVEAGRDGALLVPLGTMFAGQRRELLVRVRVLGAEPGLRPMASVYLRYRDPADGSVARVQERIVRAEVTSDPAEVEAHAQAETQSIVAMYEAARVAAQARVQVDAGQFDDADRVLASAEARLRRSAERAQSDHEKQRILATAQGVARSRSSVRHAAAAPAPMKKEAARAGSLQLNDVAMEAMGY